VLRLDEPGATLAARFHGGALARAEVTVHPVLSRWERAAELGVRADGDAHAEGTTAADLCDRRDRMDAVFREETSLLSPIADELSARSMVAIVADHEGVVLLARGGGEFVGEAARVRLVEGSRWSEATRGTNAIGTALAERRPVAVVGRAHYEERNQGLFCYATPIRDAYGEVVAALDVTGAAAHHSPAVGIAVQAAGAALERALRLREYAATTVGGYAVIERMLHRAGSPALLIEATGAVVAMNDAARAVLGVRDARDGSALTVERVFGASVDALRAVARSPGGAARFETAGTGYRLELEPIHGASGRVLSLLAYLEPLPSATLVSGAQPGLAARHAVDGLGARRSTRATAHRAAIPTAFDGILGDDGGVVSAKETSARFAPTPLPVLLLAETGTGKELFARAIHAASPRRAGAFVALNCGALAPSLLEGELFGYAPGAFTGAGRAGSDGKIAAANRGTLFLDEIAEMPEPLQAMLLRVLEAGEYYRLGDPRPRRSDFRLVAATCRDLPALVAAGRFRRDLFYRVQGACVTIPALRSRTDRLTLARGLLAELARPSGAPCPELAEDAVRWILEHTWPGNVRELKSALAHALVMTEEGEPLDRAAFPRVLVPDPTPSGEGPRSRTRGEILREAAADALRAAGGNFTEAARRLGIARSTLYRMMGSRR
jgi:transcriptional regulator of acetoin/glycerol metabolism